MLPVLLNPRTKRNRLHTSASERVQVEHSYSRVYMMTYRWSQEMPEGSAQDSLIAEDPPIRK